MSPKPLSLRSIADILCARREVITSEWIERVQAEQKIPAADALPRAELLDHLPLLFDDLTDRIREADPNKDAEDGKTARHAVAHGEHRFQQNYELQELLLETSILRAVVMRHLFTLRESEGSLSAEMEWQLLQIVHTFFDRALIASTTQFVARQQEELTTSHTQLEEEKRKVEVFNDRLLEQDERRLKTLRTISHEVRNHLNAVHVVLNALRSESDAEISHEYFEMLARNVVEISALMDQLLDFAALLSGGEAARVEQFDPSRLYFELALMLSQMAQAKGLQFHGDVAPELGTINCDRNKLRRIVMNLGTNAIKYTPTGEVRLHFAARGPAHWMIEVSDSGPGIPPEHREHIFEEFHRIPSTSEGQPGAGLGLAITRELVAVLGGAIELETEVGVGTLFRVVLPCTPSPDGILLGDEGGTANLRGALRGADSPRA